jgi:DNA-binding MarR family transcriptional regulator
MIDAPLPFGTRLIGQTEKTLNAILNRLLAGSDLTEPQWVALIVTLEAGDTSRAAAERRIATTLKIPSASGAALLAGLIEQGLVEPAGPNSVRATRTGREFHHGIRRQVDEITTRIWDDIPNDERRTAAAVLNTTLQRANAALVTLTT